MPQEDRKRIGQRLIDASLLSFDQLNTALEYQKSLGGTIGQIVVKLGFVSDEAMTEFLAKEYGLTIMDLPAVVLPLELAKKIPWELIDRHQIVPIHQSSKTLTICTADPTDYNAIEELQYATGMKIELNLAPRSAISKSIAELKDMLAHGDPSEQAPKQRPVERADEDDLLDDLRSRTEGKISPAGLTKGELREAVIPVLLKKGVISRAELYDAVIDVLVRKGVIDEGDVKPFKR